MKAWFLCAAVTTAAAVVCLSPAAQARSIYKQEVFAQNGFSSTFDSSAIFAFLAADNFPLNSPQTIGQVRWWGNSDGFNLPNLQNFTQFTVKLHERLGSGLPGAVIYQESFATPVTNPVDTGLVSFNNTKVWQQTVTLATPQSLPAGQYMLSVGPSAYVDNQGAIWFWNTATQGDGFLAFDDYQGQGWRPFSPPTDLAFELIAVPEPASTGVVAGALVMAMRRRRRGR